MVYSVYGYFKADGVVDWAWCLVCAVILWLMELSTGHGA